MENPKSLAQVWTCSRNNSNVGSPHVDKYQSMANKDIEAQDDLVVIYIYS